MAKFQTIMLPKPWLAMQLLAVEERTVTETQIYYQHHLYLIDTNAENGLRHLDTRAGATFPREICDGSGDPE